MEAIGNGHNDMFMLLFITLGLILWQKGQWAWAVFALTLATLVKGVGLVLLPLFGMATLVALESWRTRITRGMGMLAIFFTASIILYRLTGPFPAVLAGTKAAMLNRSGFSPASALLLIVQEVLPNQSYYVLPAARNIFIVYYIYLLILLAQKKMTLIEAGFMAYFSQLLLGAVFRPWYPMWLIPIAALGLNSRAYWRTFLFSITAGLSALSYSFLWRWTLSTWDWGLNGPLSPYWNFWMIMPLFTVPWTFGIPFLGELFGKWKDQKRFNNSLWI
jgi:hypothetical protein